MITSAILSIVIAIIFIFLLMSIIITALNEMIFTLLRSRSKQLEYFIEHLFFNDANWNQLFGKIKDSPFIQVLKKYPDRFPSTIPTKNFTSALLSEIGKGEITLEKLKEAVSENEKKEATSLVQETVEQSTRGFKNSIRTFFELHPTYANSPVKTSNFYKMLKVILSESKTIEEVRKEMDALFDSAMERLTGWYRRYAKKLSLLFALLLCAVLNVDTITITKNLWNNKDKAEQIADFASIASKYMEKNDSSQIVFKSGFDTLAWVKVENKALTNSKVGLLVSKIDTSKVDSAAKVKQAGKQLVTSYQILANLDIPIGWSQANYPPCTHHFCHDFWMWVLKIIGILITSVAISLGAPYWFDLLNRLTPLRKDGKG